MRLRDNLPSIDEQTGFGNSQHFEFRCVLQIHALGPLQEEKVLQGITAKGQQAELDSWGVVPGVLREVWPAKERDRSDGGEQIVHQGEVQHFLRGDQGDLALPAGDRL